LVRGRYPLSISPLGKGGDKEGGCRDFKKEPYYGVAKRSPPPPTFVGGGRSFALTERHTTDIEKD